MTLADAIGWIGVVPTLVGFSLQITTIFHRSPEREHAANGFYAVGMWLGFIANVMNTDPIWTVIYGLLAAYWTWKWWKGRRNGRMRKALRELGAKSRAKLQKLVDRITPSPAPSPAGGVS